jgi:DNA mismatch repair protein MutS
MCGIPHHALQGYLKRFVQHGLKVAICEQLTEAGKGLVERDVVRVVTPGTLVEPALLEAAENNYLAAVHRYRDVFDWPMWMSRQASLPRPSSTAPGRDPR